jgi:hypothetical protein
VPAVRPFEPTGLTTSEWKKISPSWINIDELVLVQDVVSIKGLVNAANHGPTYSGDSVPHVVIYKGKKYLSDGYHRYCVAVIRGEPLIAARIFNKDLA